MSSINKAILIGNLGADPDMRYTGSGQGVCELRIATTEKWTKDGQANEKTEWHRVVVWGKTAEACAKYLAKGRQVYVEGRIQTRSYDDREGQKRYITEIVASDVQFLGGGKGIDKDAQTDRGYTGPDPFNSEPAKEPPRVRVKDDLPF